MIIQPHDPSPAGGANIARPRVSDEAGAIDGAFRLLIFEGLSPVEAGNVVAYATGLRPAERGWTVEEIKHLALIRGLVACGVIDS